jgi:hypothetical protein
MKKRFCSLLSTKQGKAILLAFIHEARKSDFARFFKSDFARFFKSDFARFF